MLVIRQIASLLARQWYLVKDDAKNFLLNNFLLWPVIFGSMNGYFVPQAFFPDNTLLRATEMMVGALLFQTVVTVFFAGVELIKEREASALFQYHVIATSFAAAFFSRLIFYSLYTFCAVAPFLPICKCMLGSLFYTDQLSWLSLFGVIFLLTSTTTAYLFFVFSFVHSLDKLEEAWVFLMEPLLWVSGLWAPVYIIAQSGVPGVSWLLAANPFAYATDAVRYLFFHEVAFASLLTSCAVMIGATVIFSVASYYLVKRRIRAV